MFEHRGAPMLPRSAFLRRLAGYGALSTGMVLVSLGAGILGYRLTEGMSWVDAFLNASMLMGGMGPMGELHTTAGKLFAACYALYCGLVLILSVGIVAAPILHRFIHHFHLETHGRENAGSHARPAGSDAAETAQDSMPETPD